MLAKAGTLSFLASVSAVNVDVSSCVGYTVEVDNNYRFIHEDDSSVTIQILNVFSTDPQDPSYLGADGVLRLTFPSLPAIDSYSFGYPIDSVTEDGNSLNFELADAAVGSFILASSFTANYVLPRPQEQLVPSTMEYCQSTVEPTDPPLTIDSCIQEKMDAKCAQTNKAACPNFEYARFNIETGKYRCYESVSNDFIVSSCFDSENNRVDCASYGPDTPFCNLPNLADIRTEGCDAPPEECCVDHTDDVTISNTWASQSCNNQCMTLTSTNTDSSAGKKITVQFDDLVEFPSVLPYPIDFVSNLGGNKFEINFLADQDNPMSFNINLDGLASQVIEVFVCGECVETTSSTTVASTTTTTEAGQTTTTGAPSPVGCFPVPGFSYTQVEKWLEGEQFKISAEFDDDVHANSGIRDESYLKVTFDNIPDGTDLQAYWPFETGTISGNSIDFSVVDYVSGTNVANLEFQLRFSSQVSESLTLNSLEICHESSPTEGPPITSPLTDSSFCEDATLSMKQAWTARGFMDLYLNHNVQETYVTGDYIEVGFDGPIGVQQVYYPWSQDQFEDMGNNIYRFFIVNGVTNWTGSKVDHVFGQFSFVGSAEHYPDVLWTQICNKNGVDGSTTTTVEPTGPPTGCQEVTVTLESSWRSSTGEFNIEPFVADPPITKDGYLDIQFSGPLTFTSVYDPFNANNMEDLGNNKYRFFMDSNEWFQGWSGAFAGMDPMGQATFSGAAGNFPTAVSASICTGTDPTTTTPTTTTTTPTTTTTTTTSTTTSTTTPTTTTTTPTTTTTTPTTTTTTPTTTSTTDESTTPSPDLVCQDVLVAAQNFWTDAGIGQAQFYIQSRVLEHAIPSDGYLEIEFSKAVTVEDLSHPFEESDPAGLYSYLSDSKIRAHFDSTDFPGWTGEVPDTYFGLMSFAGEATPENLPSVLSAKLCFGDDSSTSTTVGSTTTNEPPTHPPEMTDASLCDPLEVWVDSSWVQRGWMNIRMSSDALTRNYEPNDYIEILFSKGVTFERVWNPLKESLNKVEDLGDFAHRLFFWWQFHGYTAPSFEPVSVAQLSYTGNAANYPEIVAAQICPKSALPPGIL